jgi:hypothetical protein
MHCQRLKTNAVIERAPRQHGASLDFSAAPAMLYDMFKTLARFSIGPTLSLEIPAQADRTEIFLLASVAGLFT